MGYYVGCAGVLTLKDAKDADKVLQGIDDHDLSELFDGSLSDDGLTIDVGGSSKYYEEDVDAFFREFADLLESASIEFNGESDNFWLLKVEDGKIREYAGHIEYDKTPCREIGTDAPELS